MDKPMNPSLAKAVEVMDCMKNGRNRVVVGLPPGGGAAGAPPQAMRRPSGDSNFEALLAEFNANLNLDACAIAVDQNGEVIEGSVYVVAVVPTAIDTDTGLL